MFARHFDLPRFGSLSKTRKGLACLGPPVEVHVQGGGEVRRKLLRGWFNRCTLLPLWYGLGGRVV